MRFTRSTSADRRRLLQLFALVTLTAMLAACAPAPTGDSAAPDAAAAEADDVTTITVWG